MPSDLSKRFLPDLRKPLGRIPGYEENSLLPKLDQPRLMKNPILLLFFLFFASSLAASHFEFTPNVRSAYEKVLSLRFVEAKSLLEKERLNNPNNLIIYYVENYIDFFTIFINENYSEFKRLEANKDRRLELIQKGNSRSPYFLYTQAEINLQWAIARLKFEENFTALREIRQAYKQLEENERKYPSFIVNKKSLGILHAMIGTIPDSYKWAVKMVGMDGTIKEGTREIEQVIKYSKYNDKSRNDL